MVALGAAVERRRVHLVPGRPKAFDDGLPDPPSLVRAVNEHIRRHDRSCSSCLSPAGPSSRSPRARGPARGRPAARPAAPRRPAAPAVYEVPGQPRRGDPQCTRWGLSAILGGRGASTPRHAPREQATASPKESAMRLAGKVALITGGASGMGQSEAMIFAREGAKVAVADVLEFEARQVVEKIAAAGGQARFVKLDVTSETDWEAAIKATVTAFGKLDLLVNNAGISGTFDPDTLSTSAWDTLLNVNAKGVFLGMKHAAPAMRAAGGGSIVNISSISGFVGQDRIHMGYNASKGAVRIMTKSAAVQFAQHGIRVNSVHPGILPPMRTSKASADPAWREKSLRAVPLKREGRVEEVAHAVLFLASDEASYITGIELPVDGGYLAV